MRLPKSKKLKKKTIYLYNYDIKGYNNPDEYSLWKIHYMEHIYSILNIVMATKAKKVLEIGCAQANISTLLAEEGFEVVALDINHNFLTYARMRHESGKIDHYVKYPSFRNLPFISLSSSSVHAKSLTSFPFDFS